MSPRAKPTNSSDEHLNQLIEAQVARKQAEQETAAQLARSNRIEQRKAQYTEDLKSEVGSLIVDVRSLLSTNRDLIRLLEALLYQTPLTDAVKEANAATQRILDHVIDLQTLILELLRFVLPNIKGNGDKARLLAAIRDLPGHPADVEDEGAEVGHIKKLLTLQHQTFRILQEREAKFGGNAPVDVIAGIAEAREKIAGLQEELVRLLEDG